MSRSLHMGFVVDKTESGRFFSGFSPVFPTTNFIPPLLLTHLIHFISSAPVLVHQAWSDSILQLRGFIAYYSLTWPCVRQELRILNFFFNITSVSFMKINPLSPDVVILAPVWHGVVENDVAQLTTMLSHAAFNIHRSVLLLMTPSGLE